MFAASIEHVYNLCTYNLKRSHKVRRVRVSYIDIRHRAPLADSMQWKESYIRTVMSSYFSNSHAFRALPRLQNKARYYFVRSAHHHALYVLLPGCCGNAAAIRVALGRPGESKSNISPTGTLAVGSP